MSTGSVTKTDLLARVYKLKTDLFNGQHHDKNGDWHDGAHNAYNEILDILNEYVR
jgi:hypothetical protein